MSGPYFRGPQIDGTQIPVEFLARPEADLGKNCLQGLQHLFDVLASDVTQMADAEYAVRELTLATGKNHIVFVTGQLPQH